MNYFLVFGGVTILPFGCGLLIGGRLRKMMPVNTHFRLMAAGAALTGWFVLSRLARGYAETDGRLWQVAEFWAHAGKWHVFSAAGMLVLGVAARTETSGRGLAGASLHVFAALLIVCLTLWRTIPVYLFLGGETRRDAEGFLRQTVPYTCGPVSLANLMERSGMSTPPGAERELSRLAGTTWEGSTMSGLIAAASRVGMRVVECRIMGIDDLERKGMPAIVFISTIPSVRHAVVYSGCHKELVELIDPDRSRIVCPRDRFKEVHYGKSLVLERIDR